MELCKLNDVEFNVVRDESPEFTNEVTSREVEDKRSVTDHVRNNPLIFSFFGLVTGVDAFEKLQKLRLMARDKKLLKYVGRNVVANVVIEVLKTTHNNSNAVGFNFEILLREIKIAKVSLVDIQAPDPAIPKIPPTTTQTEEVREQGVQVEEEREDIDINALIQQEGVQQDDAKETITDRLRENVFPLSSYRLENYRKQRETSDAPIVITTQGGGMI